MVAILQKLVREYYNSLPHADPRTRDWLLLKRSPIQVWLLTALYFVVVWLGPKYMKNRPAYSLRGFLVVYNLGLVVLSLYMFVEILLSTSGANYEWFCAPYNEETRQRPEELRVAQVLWWYFFSKAIELMDTVLMILRKRNRQITFLHVFHHASMLNIWWWVCMFTPGGLSYFGSGLNCLVHVIMYLYYGLSAIPSLRSKLWWKTYITQFQLTQFCITLYHTCYSYVYPCDFPIWGQNLLSSYMLIMLALFGNFYIKSYLGKRSPRKESKSASLDGLQNGNMLHNGNGHIVSNGNKKMV